MRAKGTLLTKAKATAAGTTRYHALCDARRRSAAVAIAESARRSQLRHGGQALLPVLGRGTGKSACPPRKPKCPCLSFEAHAYAAAGSTSAAAVTAKNHDTPNRSITPRPIA